MYIVHHIKTHLKITLKICYGIYLANLVGSEANLWFVRDGPSCTVISLFIKNGLLTEFTKTDWWTHIFFYVIEFTFEILVIDVEIVRMLSSWVSYMPLCFFIHLLWMNAHQNCVCISFFLLLFCSVLNALQFRLSF